MTPKGIVAKCDFCDKQAVYDGKTTLGPWAYMCEAHRRQYGVKSTQLMNKLETVGEPKKVCVLCGEEKPLSQFYQYTDHGGIQRYRSECKVCNLAQKRRKYNSQ